MRRGLWIAIAALVVVGSGIAAGFRQLCKRKKSDGHQAGDGHFLLE